MGNAQEDLPHPAMPGAPGAAGALSTRSVLASAMLGQDPPELPVSHLVHLAGLFGMSENRARVALTRMVASGEAITDGAGNYRLAGHLLERRRRQEASRAGLGARDAWGGDWTTVIVTVSGSAPDVRGERRRVLQFARLGELRDGVWLRPDNLAVELPAAVETDVLRAIARVDDPVSLAARLWPLDAWAARANELLAALDSLEPTDWRDLAPGFELSAAVLRHFQADPLLPPDLLPASWPGDRLRAAYGAWDARYRTVLVDWGRTA